MFQAVGRVQLVAQQPVRHRLASQERNQARVDLIQPPRASAVGLPALEIAIHALGTIPGSLALLSQDGHLGLNHG